MKLVYLKNSPIYDQLALEEALLRVGQGTWCLLNSGSPPAIVLGISGKEEELVEKECPLPLIRRFSGGGTVVVDPDTLFITFIGMMPHPTPSKIHAWAFERLQPLFQHLPFTLKENDYVLHEKKCGGNAQYIAKERFLHHTSLLWLYDRQLMSYLKMPQKTPLYRMGRAHGAFLTELAPYFPSKEAFFQKLIASLQAREALTDACPDELRQLRSIPHRQALKRVAISGSAFQGLAVNENREKDRIPLV